MKSICVYAGSAIGANPEYTNQAMNLGHMIAEKNFSMVYGGGTNGLMGVTANAALSRGVAVTGIITEQLNEIEVGHKGLTKLEIVPSMHKRKARMARNPQTGEPIKVKASRTVGFKVGKKFKEKV